MNFRSVPSFDKSPCPCCGCIVFDGNPGTEEICPVCYWQDDLFGLLDPFSALGPNKVSLVEAQKNFALIGLCDPRYANVKNRLADPKRCIIDEGWRPVDLAKDRFPQGADYPSDEARAYYWRPDYWLNPGQN
jgi:hypothetical protein